MHVEDAGLAVGLQCGADRISEAALLPDLLEQSRRGAAADDIRKQTCRIIIACGRRGALEGERQMRLLARQACDPIAARESGLPRGACPAFR